MKRTLEQRCVLPNDVELYLLRYDSRIISARISCLGNGVRMYLLRYDSRKVIKYQGSVVFGQRRDLPWPGMPIGDCLHPGKKVRGRVKHLSEKAIKQRQKQFSDFPEVSSRIKKLMLLSAYICRNLECLWRESFTRT
jgi:hypothetical protein